jgi:hypothetical protein
MAILTCESCLIEFKGRPNRRYCSPECRREAEMKERKRKKEERRKAWLASLSPEDRAFYDDLKEFSTEGLKEFSTEGLKEFSGEEFSTDGLKEFSTEDLQEFEIKPPVKGQKRRQKR